MKDTSTIKTKWSDIVAERNINGTERKLTSVQNIQTVLNSRTSQITNINRRRNGTMPSNIITVPTSRCENNHGNKVTDANDHHWS